MLEKESSLNTKNLRSWVYDNLPVNGFEYELYSKFLELWDIKEGKHVGADILADILVNPAEQKHLFVGTPSSGKTSLISLLCSIVNDRSYGLNKFSPEIPMKVALVWKLDNHLGKYIRRFGQIETWSDVVFEFVESEIAKSAQDYVNSQDANFVREVGYIPLFIYEVPNTGQRQLGSRVVKNFISDMTKEFGTKSASSIYINHIFPDERNLYAGHAARSIGRGRIGEVDLVSGKKEVSYPNLALLMIDQLRDILPESQIGHLTLDEELTLNAFKPHLPKSDSGYIYKVLKHLIKAAPPHIIKIHDRIERIKAQEYYYNFPDHERPYSPSDFTRHLRKVEYATLVPPSYIEYLAEKYRNLSSIEIYKVSLLAVSYLSRYLNQIYDNFEGDKQEKKRKTEHLERNVRVLFNQFRLTDDGKILLMDESF